MATLEDNVLELGRIVLSVKKTYHLSEPTVLRLLDTTLALMQQNAGEAMKEPMPSDEELAEMLNIPETEEPTTTEEQN